MAHFAEIDANSIVTRVLVVANDDCLDANGQENEAVGAGFLARLLGGRWLQTSYNATIRKNYAGIGYTYDQALDAFVPPQPFPSWALNSETCQWTAPIPMPTDGGLYMWDEPTLTWVAV